MSEEKRRGFSPVILFVILLGCAWGFLQLAQLREPLPKCYLRRWMGIPCPFCGGSHSFLAWAQGDWFQSMKYNPLVFIISSGICVFFLLWVASLIGKNPEWVMIPIKFRRHFTTILFTVLLLNELYLIWMFGGR